MMRLFIAIHLPPALSFYCQKLQAQFPGLKRVNEFHLTLQFLGDEIPEERVMEIIEKLKTVTFQPFKITLGDAVPFGHHKRPHGVWIECRGSAALHPLADQIRSATGNLGFLPDKPFAAHVTLGRYKNDPPTIPRRVTGEPHPFRVDRFYLMESHLVPEGPKYKVLETFPAS